MKDVKEPFRYSALLMVMLLSGSFSAWADIVKGNVVGESVGPLIGVTVRVDGTYSGTATDIYGTTGEVLERATDVHDISAVLTDNLSGVVTIQSSGMPGDESAKITIRGASSWNNSDPLVLVDGIEHDMNSVDVFSVKSISVPTNNIHLWTQTDGPTGSG